MFKVEESHGNNEGRKKSLQELKKIRNTLIVGGCSDQVTVKQVGNKVNNMFKKAKKNKMSFTEFLKTYDITYVNTGTNNRKQKIMNCAELKDFVEAQSRVIEKMSDCIQKEEDTDFVQGKYTKETIKNIDFALQVAAEYGDKGKSKIRNTNLTLGQLQDKVSALKIEVMYVKSKLQRLQMKEVSNDEYKFILKYRQATEKLECAGKSNIVAEVVNGIASGRFPLHTILFDFCMSQFLFFNCRNFDGAVKKLLYSEKEVMFWTDFFNRHHAGAIEFLRGLSETESSFRQAQTEEEAKLPKNSPCLWRGNFVIPSLSTLRRHNKKTVDGRIGFTETRLNNVVSHINEVKKMFPECYIFGSLNLDETDFGVKCIQVSKDGSIKGAVDYGGVEELLGLDYKSVKCIETDIRHVKNTLPDFPKVFDAFECDLTFVVLPGLEFAVNELKGFEGKFNEWNKVAKLRLQKKEDAVQKIVTRNHVQGNLLAKANYAQKKAVNVLQHQVQLVKTLQDEFNILYPKCKFLLQDLKAATQLSDPSLYVRGKYDEVRYLFNKCKMLLIELHKFECVVATKLQVFTVADSQRVSSIIYGICMIQQERPEQLRKIINYAIDNLLQKGVCICNVSFDGASRKLAYIGNEGPTFLSEHVRDIKRAWDKEKLGIGNKHRAKMQCLIEKVKGKLHDFITELRVCRGFPDTFIGKEKIMLTNYGKYAGFAMETYKDYVSKYSTRACQTNIVEHEDACSNVSSTSESLGHILSEAEGSHTEEFPDVYVNIGMYQMFSLHVSCF